MARTALVIDDDDLMRYYLRERLQEAGFLVREGGRGADVTKLVDSGAFDVAIVDYRLPDTTGLTILARIKSRQPNCCAILISAYSTPELAKAALEQGACFVLDKPFDSATLLRLLAWEHKRRPSCDPPSFN